MRRRCRYEARVEQIQTFGLDKNLRPSPRFSCLIYRRPHRSTRHSYISESLEHLLKNKKRRTKNAMTKMWDGGPEALQSTSSSIAFGFSALRRNFLVRIWKRECVPK